MENPFETLQQQLTQIHNQLSQLSFSQSVTPDAEVIFNVDQAAKYLEISQSTLYSNKGNVTHYRRFNRLYFFKTELMDYLKGASMPAPPVSIRQPRRTRKRKADN